MVALAEEISASGIIVAGLPVAFLVGEAVLYSEAHLTFLLLGWFALLLVRNEGGQKGGLLAGLAGGLLILSRLDMVFIVIAGLVYLSARARSPRAIIATWGGAALCVLPYIASNTAFFGGLVPVSGWMKSSFPHPNLTLRLIIHHGLGASVLGYSIVFGFLPLLLGVLRPAEFIFDNVMMLQPRSHSASVRVTGLLDSGSIRSTREPPQPASEAKFSTSPLARRLNRLGKPGIPRGVLDVPSEAAGGC